MLHFESVTNKTRQAKKSSIMSSIYFNSQTRRKVHKYSCVTIKSKDIEDYDNRFTTNVGGIVN